MNLCYWSEAIKIILTFQYVKGMMKTTHVVVWEIMKNTNVATSDSFYKQDVYHKFIFFSYIHYLNEPP